jgi:MFS family permease
MTGSKRMPAGRNVDAPYWAPLARQRLAPLQIAGIVMRHSIPLVGMLWFGWSAGQFLLLSVFNIAFGIACIGTVGVAVSTASTPTGLADSVGTWLSLVAVAIGISALLTLMFGWVVALLVGGAAFDVSLAWSALAMVVTALPGLITQYQTDLRAGLSEEQRKQRDQPNVLTLAMCGALIFILSGYAAKAGGFGVAVMVIGVTALFLFRDLRPDLMRELTRPAHRPPS